MKSISGKRLCKIVEHKGWVLKRVTGSHHIYENPEIEQILSIPVHRNQDLKVGTLRALMKIAQLSEEDLQSLS
jgi:predicted RNA binding protein YcfA (HicA-like mRNA interferase family)